MDVRRGRLVGVVDDDRAVRESLRFLLETAGFRVVAFSSAEQFLASADFPAIGCLLLDQHMPKVSGLELLQRLAAAGRRIPVALMTGSPSARLTQQALALGAATVLEKPMAEYALMSFVEASVR